MTNIPRLVQMLEFRFKHTAQGEEKLLILNLLRLYYPIIQKSMTKTIEVRDSKANLKKLEEECLHLNSTKSTTMSFIFTCDDCGETIYK